MEAAGELVTTIGGMAGAAKAIADAIKTIRDQVQSKSNPTVDKAIAEALQQTSSFLARQIEIQAAILRLQAENAELAKKVRGYQDRARAQKKYHLKKVGQSWIMRPKDGTDAYGCPNCLESEGHLIVLQRHPKMGGFLFVHTPTHLCPRCRTEFFLTEPIPSRTIVAPKE
ncbi:MAG TPA: hypothetical protein VNJ70_10930 [Thermoanaerobaculia bacterium]|nr:hypothetical protein [Thermoanaerobaculia bacterium]